MENLKTRQLGYVGEYRSPRLPPMTEKEYNIIRSYRKITVIGSKKNLPTEES